jgi:ABC-type lipoprotein export system ATPase subunit
VIQLLRGLAAAGACVLIATHDAAVSGACDVRIDLAERGVTEPPVPAARGAAGREPTLLQTVDRR